MVDTSDTSASARVTRISSPIASPGNCGLCGTATHEQGFADPRLDFEFYGTLYFCADCCGEFASLFGFLSPGQVVELRDHIAAQDLELNTLRQAVLGLEATVDGLVADAHRRSSQRADAINRGRAFDGHGDVIKRPVDESDEGPAKPNPPVPVNVPDEPANRPAQQTNEQGRDNLFDTSGADELLGL